jgi:uncharacterized protein
VILSFTFSNFRAFKDVQTLNFDAGKADKELVGNCFSPDLPGLREAAFVKAVALYGANASGKSSVLDALKCLANWVAGSANIVDPEEPINGIESFALTPSGSTEPTAFGIIFITGGVRYEYRVAATTARIYHESLRAFPTPKPQIWFSRDWNEKDESYEWTPDRPSGYHPDAKMREFTLPNVLFLSKAISLGDLQLEPIYRWFKEGLRFFDLSVQMRGVDNEFTVQEFEKDTALSKQVVELLSHSDIGVIGAVLPEREEAFQLMISEIWNALPSGEGKVDRLFEEIDKTDFSRYLEEIRKGKRQRPSGPANRVKLIHRGADGEGVPLPWSAESAGTRRLFTLAGPLLDILRKGQVVCIDELDTSIHPKMVCELLRLVFQAETNHGGAQILFTTHNPLLLDPTLLRRDQVWFTEKDIEGKSHLYPLTDFHPRKDESWARGYMAGRYGGIPYIPQGLLGSPEETQLERTEES